MFVWDSVGHLHIKTIHLTGLGSSPAYLMNYTFPFLSTSGTVLFTDVHTQFNLCFFLLVNNILIILNQEHCANFTTWTRPNSCTINQILCISCEPQQKSQCISHVYEEIDEKCIRVTKPPMYLHHRKLQLQFMQLRRSLEMQLIVAFKVL